MVALAGLPLAVDQHLIVEGVVEGDAEMALQRGSARARRRLSMAISATMLPGASKSRGRTSYFSESRYSSRPGSAAASHSSKPE